MSDKLNSLSKAIKFGSTLSKQAFGAWSQADHRCALQSALHAIAVASGGIEQNADANYLTQRFGLNANFPCLVCRARKIPKLYSITSLVMHMNDKHKMTREQIADVLEALGN